MTKEVKKELYKHSLEDGALMLTVLSEIVLPIVYKRRVGFKILYLASADPHWISFVEKHYYNWTSLYISVNAKNLGVSHKFLHRYMTKQIVSLIVL